MSILPNVTVLSGIRKSVPVAPLPKHFSRQANSERPALIYNDEACNICISYKQLEARTNSLARALAIKARPSVANHHGDYMIGICMQPTPNTVMAILATWKLGAAYVPIDPCFPRTRISHILTDVEAALVIYDENSDTSKFINDRVPGISFEELYQESSAFSEQDLDDAEMLSELISNSVAVVLYTSGSTGIPKGVRLTHSAICYRLWWEYHTFPHSETEEMCVWKTVLTFIDSVFEIWGTLLYGRTLLIIPKETTKDPQKLVQILTQNQIHRIMLVPTHLRCILSYLSFDSSPKALKYLKLWMCSGETLSKELAADFFKYFGNNNGYKLVNCYGCSEVTGDVTNYVLENSAQLDLYATIPIGVPLFNCDIYLMDKDMNVVQQEEIGEVCVAGVNIAMGYVGEQVSDKFCENPHESHPDYKRLYRTGDYGVVQNGVLLFVGRKDTQIKIRGHRVDLQEVERTVAAIPGIKECIVLCNRASRNSPEILSFVTTTTQTQSLEQQIEDTLKNKLTDYMRPQMIIMEKLPLLVNGKVDRQLLLKMYNDDAAISLQFDYTGVNSKNVRATQVLFETVGEVLGKSVKGRISLKVGFFEIGGNSLNSVFAITRLQEKGYYIDISDFLEAANLGEVLMHVNNNPNNLGHNLQDTNCEKFTVEPLRDEHKQQVIDMMVSSFYEKAELHQVLKHEITIQDYAVYINAIWDTLLEAGVSVALTDGKGLPVAAVLNHDARHSHDVKLSGGFGKIKTFIKHLEDSVEDKILSERKGNFLYSTTMMTAASLSPADNVAAILALAHATLRIARERQFVGVFASNTSPLTQQLDREILGFRTLLDYQVNQYVDTNGDKIFEAAPDDMKIIICWKPID